MSVTFSQKVNEIFDILEDIERYHDPKDIYKMRRMLMSVIYRHDLDVNIWKEACSCGAYDNARKAWINKQAAQRMYRSVNRRSRAI